MYSNVYAVSLVPDTVFSPQQLVWGDPDFLAFVSKGHLSLSGAVAVTLTGHWQ